MRSLVILLLSIVCSSVYGELEEKPLQVFPDIVLGNHQERETINVVIYVSFVITKTGGVDKVVHQKTECLEYELSKLNMKKVHKLEKEAVKTIKNIDEFAPVNKPVKTVQPIRMTLFAKEYLIAEK